MLVVDDSTLDKPYAKKMALVHRHGSGKHHAVVEGINLITLLWSEGDRHVPLDYRIYDKAGDTLTKNDHFRTLLETAHTRGLVPECVVFDSGYSSLENLKPIRAWDWVWLNRLKANRLVNPDRTGARPVAPVDTDAHGQVVHLKGYGLIRLFLIVTPDGDKDYWATNDLNMKALTRVRFASYAWTIETYHRGISSTIMGSNALRFAPLALNAIISVLRYAPSYAWSAIVIAKESAGLRRNSLSSAPPSAPI